MKKVFLKFFGLNLQNSENWYDAKLPFKETHHMSHHLFSDNFNLCQKKLMNLYSKLKNDPELLKRYNEILLSKGNYEW